MFVLYKAKISGERLQDHWSCGYLKVLEVLDIPLNSFFLDMLSLLLYQDKQFLYFL